MSDPEQDGPRLRDPVERKTLEDALKIAGVIVDKAAEGETVDSEVYTLAAGFLVLAGDMAAMLDAAKKATHYCGWCQRANGDSRIDLATYTLDEVREHTVRCEHNPVVAELAKVKSDAERMRPVFDAALDYCHAPSGCWQSEARLVEAAGLAAAEIAIERKNAKDGAP